MSGDGRNASTRKPKLRRSSLTRSNECRDAASRNAETWRARDKGRLGEDLVGWKYFGNNQCGSTVL